MDGKKILLLVLIAAAFVAGCVQQAGQEKTGEKPQTPSTREIPVYSGSNVYSTPTFFYQIIGIPTEGVSMDVYYVEGGSVNDVLSWYKGKMKDYTLINQMPVVSISTPQGKAEWGGLLFQKDNQAVGIWAIGGQAVESGKGVVYYIAKGSIDRFTGWTGTGEKEHLPSSDKVSGEEPIERYPGAVMLSYEKTNGFPAMIYVDYGTMDSAEKVFEWYRQNLAEKGWEIVSERKEEDMLSLDLKKGNENLGVLVYPPTSEVNYTKISIEYGSYKLPSSDQVSGKEPIERYPGAVMLDHASTNIGGGEMITITYGSNDEPNTIFNWYINELQKSGWQIMSKSTYGSTLSISAFKEGNTAMVEISKDAYTQIEVTYQEIPQQ